MATATRVLIVAADPLARASLAALLQEHNATIITGQSADSDDLVEACAVHHPDVLLWDAGWGGAVTLEALASLDEALPPILAIAAADAASALWAAGVRGVVGRNVSVEALILALAAVAGGLGVFEPAVAGEGEWQPPAARPVTATELLEPLTPRELDVLRAMADGLSNKLIARTLEISEHTVKYHVNAILGKLNAQSRTDAVVRATRAGILLL
jgi:DNA-binding NarL/FixJ family response regulator